MVGSLLIVRGRTGAWFSCLLALIGCCGIASADGLSDEPVDLRIHLTLDRISAFSDVMGRSNASVAHPLPSSVNPAADDVMREAPFDFSGVATSTLNLITFESDATISGVATTGLYRLPQRGTLSATYVRADTFDGSGRDGDHYGLRSNEFYLGYSWVADARTAFGGEVKVSDSTLNIARAAPFAPFSVIETRSDTTGLLVRGGVQRQMGDGSWSVGAVGGVEWLFVDADVDVSLPLAPGVSTTDADETIWGADLRAGLGWRPSEAWGFYLDGQYRHLDSDRSRIDLGRFSGGAEWAVVDGLTLRAGGTADTEGELSLAAGVEWVVDTHLVFEFGYSDKAFPEVHREFGDGRLFTASVVLLFY